ncbi:MAG: regulator for granule-associated protein [Candidatus Magnetoglobus multicellularis str. Araruama]|uniref:Regulator for granule-associated protein n=1 Tax=Candidatus Magnetoglobus multicellularis str. Araruama TaxID=890399 RepID=A0A1V1PFZ2_9BACT|nr:MAG: regulator for granule-associated protein [Candidatus Magnetoglobus multicellularis str. Araruama]
MSRLIKRYGSRKLYDTKESSYVSLDKIASWIREGQEIRVIDKKTSEDLTEQVLTHIISEEGRQGKTLLSIDLLHDLIRVSNKTVSDGVEHIQQKVDKVDRYVHKKVDNFVQSSLDQIGPVRRMREEMAALRRRVEELESSLQAIDPGIHNSKNES